MADRIMVVGDLEPPLRGTVSLDDDLTTAESIEVRIVGPTEGPEANSVFLEKACTIITNNGDGSYRLEADPWEEGETDLAGDYLVDFRVDWGSDRDTTLPARARKLRFIDGLGPSGS